MNRRKKAAAIQDAIRRVLYEDWDPIGISGIAPRDEYDAYIAGVYKLIASKRSDSHDALVEFLARVEADNMGLTPSEAAKLRLVAKKLLSLSVWNSSDDA
jgi:hypothetical protein